MIKLIERKTTKPVILILDDLEKTSSLKKLERILIDHVHVLDLLKCSLILTIPPMLKYSEQFLTHTAYFSHYSLPLFKPLTLQGDLNMSDIKKMFEIILKRIPKNIIDIDAMTLAAVCSGGILSDFLSLCRHGILKAITYNQNTVTSKLIIESFYELRNKFNSISLDDKRNLNMIHKTKTPNSMNALKDLMYSSLVLQYQDSEKELWYDVNPIMFSTEEIERIHRRV